MSSTIAPTFTTSRGDGDDLRRRRRLQHLIETRDRLAVAVASLEAHRLGDVGEASRVLYALEAVVQKEFPADYPRLFDTWLGRDDDLAHDGTAPAPDCPICGLAGGRTGGAPGTSRAA